jgi:hypothetical protein
MKRALWVTAVKTLIVSAKLRGSLWAVTLVWAGCSSTVSDRANEVGAAISPESSQVKPAASRVPSAPELIAEPESEAAELPRGVSAPQPNPHDQEPESAARNEPASAAAAPSKPSSKPVEAPAKPLSSAPAASKPSQPKVAVRETSALAASKPSQPKVAVRETSAPAASKPSQSKPAVRETPAPAASRPSQPKPRPVAPAPPLQPPIPVEPIAELPAAAPKAAVVVPQTDHVRVEVPAGLQHWLDEDDRMRPWLSKAVNVADSCYAKVRADNPSAAGVIALAVTMHENARPSGSVSSVSSPISGIVMCATTGLLGVKMPLFTGKEGESYTVRVRFDP